MQKINLAQKQAHQKATGELPELTVDEAFGRYYQEKGQFNTRPQQTITRLNNLRTCLNVKYVHEIDEVSVNNFIAEYRQKVSNSTINRYLCLLSVVLNTARDEWHIKTTHFKISKLKLKEPAENIKFIKDWSTAQKIIDRAPAHLKPIIYTALYTGLRLGNILRLKWEEVDFVNNRIIVKVKDKTKQGGKNLTIPMIDKLAEILKSQPRINEYVFNYRNHPITSIQHAWQGIFYKKKANGSYGTELKDAELKYINFHGLRHTAATWILQKTNNLRITKEILGHSDIKTTLKYAHVLDDEKRKALEDVFQ